MRSKIQRSCHGFSQVGRANVWKVLAERLLERSKGRLCKSNCSHGVAFNQKRVDVHRLRINLLIKGHALLAARLF